MTVQSSGWFFVFALAAYAFPCEAGILLSIDTHKAIHPGETFAFSISVNGADRGDELDSMLVSALDICGSTEFTLKGQATLPCKVSDRVRPGVYKFQLTGFKANQSRVDSNFVEVVVLPLSPLTEIGVSPTALQFAAPGEAMVLQVEASENSGRRFSLEGIASFKSANPQIATVGSDGMVNAVSSGATTITVSAAQDGLAAVTKVIPVTVGNGPRVESRDPAKNATNAISDKALSDASAGSSTGPVASGLVRLHMLDGTTLDGIYVGGNSRSLRVQINGQVQDISVSRVAKIDFGPR